VREGCRIRQNFFYLRQLLDFFPESFEGLRACDRSVLNRIGDQLYCLFKFSDDLQLLLKFALRARGNRFRLRYGIVYAETKMIAEEFVVPEI